MRCPECNKFPRINAEADPEVEVEVDGVSVTGTIRIVNCCDDCGTELTEYTFEFEKDIETSIRRHEKEYPLEGDATHDLEVEVDLSRTDRMHKVDRHGKPITNPRFHRHMYGVSGSIDITCSCGKPFELYPAHQTIEDEVQASHMDSLV